MRVKRSTRILISGGGTGGHIFPAISIANALREINHELEILFVGALGQMEMERIPEAGYRIVGLPIAGLQRSLSLKNLSFPFKLLRSLRQASRIVKDFKPDVAIGVGGYASGPVLWMAQRRGIPTLIQEQNSYAGLTNKLLGRRANAICVAYKGMERYFPKERIVLTGNPIRQELASIEGLQREATEYFGVPEGNHVVLVIGGSLGARTINRSIMGQLAKLLEKEKLTLIWQTGKIYYSNIKMKVAGLEGDSLKVYDFISRMDLAYSIANLVVSRAGACTISELSQVGKPTILIPSPNVAEDHQTKNAKALVSEGAAIMITDERAPEQLADRIIESIDNPEILNAMSERIRSMAIANSAELIARKVLELVGGESNDI